MTPRRGEVLFRLSTQLDFCQSLESVELTWCPSMPLNYNLQNYNDIDRLALLGEEILGHCQKT